MEAVVLPVKQVGAFREFDQKSVGVKPVPRH
jgi:hypothetical protein